MEEVTETSLVLERILRALGDEWGPLGVALAAAEFTDKEVLIRELRKNAVPESKVHVSSAAPMVKDIPELGEYFGQPQPTRPDPGRTERKDGTPPDPDEPGWFDKLQIALRARKQARKARAGKPASFRQGTATKPAHPPKDGSGVTPPRAHACGCSSKGMAYAHGIDPDEPILMGELGTDRERWI